MRTVVALLLLSQRAATFVVPLPTYAPSAHASPRLVEPTMAVTRRQVLPVALLSLLGGRIAVLVGMKEEFQPPATSAFDPEQAILASRAAGECPVQSCNKARMTEMQYLLDVDKASTARKGSAKTHAPIVWVGAQQQEANRPYAAKIVVVANEASGDSVRLMWLVNAATKQIVGSHVVDAVSSQAGVMSGAASQGEGDGPITLVSNVKEPFAGVAAGTTLLPYVLYKNDGLWAGEPIVLCEDASCSGALGPRDFMLDTRGRRPRGDVGAELLQKAAALR